MPFICQAKHISWDRHLLFKIQSHADSIRGSAHMALTPQMTPVTPGFELQPKNTSQKYWQVHMDLL